MDRRYEFDENDGDSSLEREIQREIEKENLCKIMRLERTVCNTLRRLDRQEGTPRQDSGIKDMISNGGLDRSGGGKELQRMWDSLQGQPMKSFSEPSEAWLDISGPSAVAPYPSGAAGVRQPLTKSKPP